MIRVSQCAPRPASGSPISGSPSHARVAASAVALPSQLKYFWASSYARPRTKCQTWVGGAGGGGRWWEEAGGCGSREDGARVAREREQMSVSTQKRRRALFHLIGGAVSVHNWAHLDQPLAESAAVARIVEERVDEAHAVQRLVAEKPAVLRH